MSKVFIIDHGEVGAALALRAAEHGHTVYWMIEPKEGNNLKTGDGLHPNIIKVQKDWMSVAAGCDLVVSTENGNYLNRLELLRKRGVKVFAPSQAVADLEIKRGLGLKFLEDHGIEVPEYMTFKTMKEAQDYVYENPDRYVFKTLGDNDDKALTYVGKSAEQMIQQLQTWMDTGMNPMGEVMLQKFIKGEEFAVMRWVGRDGFIGPIQESVEHKKLFNGEKGPNTGEMGTVGKYVRESKLFDEVLAPLEADLVKMGAFTSIDLNCIIDEKGQAWPLEFTSRWGWPIFNILLYAHKGDPIQWMMDACEGLDTLETTFETLIGVCLTIPDFPYCLKPLEEVSDIPIYGLNDKLMKHIQPQSIKMGKFIDSIDDKLEETEGWVTSGSYVAVVCAAAETIEEAKSKVYDTIDELSISNLGYRTDIGDKVLKSLPILQKLGYATDWEM